MADHGVERSNCAAGWRTSSGSVTRPTTVADRRPRTQSSATYHSAAESLTDSPAMIVTSPRCHAGTLSTPPSTGITTPVT
jgi:hypothetical protein